MTHLNRLYCRKLINGIAYTARTIPAPVGPRIIQQQLDALMSEFPARWHGLVQRIKTTPPGTLEFFAGLDLAMSLIGPRVYAEMLAGQVAKIDGKVCRKTKAGVMCEGNLLPHPAGDRRIVEITA